MDFKEYIKKGKEVQSAYADFNNKKGLKNWGALEYTGGLVGDVGDLMKLVMAKSNLRFGEEVDKKLAHELADCLWSLIVIAEELGVDLEKEFINTMEMLKKRIESENKN